MTFRILFGVYGVCLVLLIAGCSGGNPAPDSGAEVSKAIPDMPDEDFQWPEAPDLMATISGHWSIDGGEIYFGGEKKKDDIGFSYIPGTFVPSQGDAVEFRWEPNPDAFGELQEGVNYYFETMLMVTADVDLPFASGGATNIRFVPNEYKKGLFSYYLSDNSLETKEVPFARIDDKQAP